MGIGAGVGAAIGAVGSIGGALINSSSASGASKTQQASSNAALQQQAAQTAYMQQNAQPFIAAGQNGLSRQTDLIDNYNDTINPYQTALNAATPGNFDQATLAATPGYQFTLAQGLKATQNAAAARGLGVSGAALRGAADYATGLSDSTYNTRFNQAQTEYSDASNNLAQRRTSYGNLNDFNNYTIGIGENAAVGSGNTGQAGATNAGNISTASGNAQAASGIAQGNALASGIGSIGSAVNGYVQNQQLQNLLTGNAGGSEYAYGQIAAG